MHKLIIYLILATLWSACDMADKADPVVISTIQADMQIDLANPFDAPMQFAFRMSTLEEKCADAQILADGAIQGQSVHIAVSGLLVEPNCSGDLEKVKKDVNIDLLPGNYDFSLAIGEDLFNTGVLSFDGIAYTLEMYSVLGIKIGHSNLYKIPEGVIWGSISGNQSLSELTGDFISALNPIISEVELQEGYYGHFTMQKSGIQNLMVAGDVVFDFNYSFVYRLGGDLDALQSVIDNFRAQYGADVEIFCTTWKGDSL
jgi:hypothetical protein